ncbi:phage holin family protein [Xenorhabdus hominickii]|uniref:Membrane protein n=1 Tax=Xenorhabdus hominickii TaxID=351679 RepID=A0A2G0QG24_XENHO|nr:phage holin family protein [Xenorhabdus hominickii]AOM42182.1 hypothetical protein A9255_17440 [Xenorhabdus hominickii]PHM58180.1 membrane protein [Xenorhabdus hominickii]
MTQTPHSQGPGKGLFDTLRRVTAIVVRMVETRLQLVAVELEEGATILVQLLLMVGFTMLFAGFGLMCLLILIFLAVDPVYRITAMAITAGTLLILAAFGAIWTLKKARKLTFLHATREQLSVDSKMLKDDHHD